MRKSRTAPQCFTIDLGESHNPESIRYYPATLVHKMRPSVSVNLTINGDRLEVIPAKRKTSIAGRFLPLNLASPSTVSQIAIDKLGGCEMVEKKSGGEPCFYPSVNLYICISFSGRVVFRILHKNETEWKSHTYEAEESVAKEFQEISERIISRRPVTAARQEFLRGSFHSAPRQSSMRKISTFSRIRRLQSFE